MAEIHSGTNGPINFKTYYNGIARDPDYGYTSEDYTPFPVFGNVPSFTTGYQLACDPLDSIWTVGTRLRLNTAIPTSPIAYVEGYIDEIAEDRDNFTFVADTVVGQWQLGSITEWNASVIDLPELGMPQVTIFYEDATSGAVLQAQNTDVDSGSFFVHVPIVATTNYKYFYLKIDYKINGVTFSDRKHYVVTRPYATVADIVDYSGYGVDTVDSNYKTYDEIMSAERYARFKINAFTGQKFDYAQKTISALGDGVDVLLLPERIESVSRVWENDVLVYDAASTSNQVTLKVTDTNYAIAIDKGAGLEVFESYPYQADRPNAGYFNNGSKYTIQGMFGYKNVPIEIYDCTIRLANDFFHQDTVWKEKYVKSMQTGDWSVDISPAAYTGTGNSAVDRMLEPFVANRMVVI